MKNEPNETVLRARSGDADSMEKLIEQYRPMIERAVDASYTGLSGSTSREDVMQEALLAFSRAIDSFDSDRGVTFGAYSRKCVRNALISHARRENAQRRKKKPVPPPAKKADEEKTEFLIRSLECLYPTLTSLERTVLGYTVRGYRPREIAEATGRTPKSVYNALCRVREKASRIKM